MRRTHVLEFSPKPKREAIIDHGLRRRKADEAVLALLYLTSFTEHGVTRAWKGHDWDVLNRSCEKGLISDPKSKNKSVVLSEEAAKESAKLFWKYFGKQR